MEKCPDICYLKRADGTENVLEARRTIFGTMIYGGVNKIEKHNNEKKPKLTAQWNTIICGTESENILNVKETPLVASLFSGISTSDHGHNWSFNYYDQKFATISSTFEIFQAEIEIMANIIKATEKAQAKHWYDGIIMKIVIFTLITFSL